MQKTDPKQTPRFFRIAQVIGIIGVSLLVINFVYQLWRVHIVNQNKTTANLCDLQVGSCTKQLPNNQAITFSITPTPIQTDVPSQVTVTLTGMHPDRVAVLVFPFPATGPAAKPIMLKAQPHGNYIGQVLIKKTTKPLQPWVAMVVIKNGTMEISAPFRFNVKNS